MRLYHGSNVSVREPVLMPLVRTLDFGRAFYVTSSLEQAARWARTSVLRRESGVATVTSFEFDEKKANELKRLHFPAPTVEWLQFVTRNRNQPNVRLHV